jgi:hypothetical protein
MLAPSRKAAVSLPWVSMTQGRRCRPCATCRRCPATAFYHSGANAEGVGAVVHLDEVAGASAGS